MTEENLENKYKAQLAQLKKAVLSLNTVLSMPTDKEGVVRDSTIQRFEFCVDLSWKTLKTFLSLRHEVSCASPKSCIREAFSVGVIESDDEYWLQMLHMRNLSSHTYNEDLAQEIYLKIPEAVKKFEKLILFLEE